MKNIPGVGRVENAAQRVILNLPWPAVERLLSEDLLEPVKRRNGALDVHDGCVALAEPGSRGAILRHGFALDHHRYMAAPLACSAVRSILEGFRAP